MIVILASFCIVSARIEGCYNGQTKKCTEVDTNLISFMQRSKLTQVIVWGYKSRHTHSWIHRGVFEALVAAAGTNFNVTWSDDTTLPPLRSLVVATLSGTPHKLAVAPIDRTSQYILLVNKGGDTFSGANQNWIKKIKAVLWAPNLAVAPNNVKGCLIQPWPGPATKCEVISSLCIASLIREPLKMPTTAVFVGSLWKPNQKQLFIRVVNRLKQKHNISTVHYGWCKDCGSWPVENGFKSCSSLDAKNASLVQQQAFMSFDLRSDNHITNEYVPDRWFKLAAMGKLVVTNSKSVKALFGNAAVAESDIDAMVDKAVILSKDSIKLFFALQHAAKVVREQHTYSHRIKTLITLLSVA